MNGNKKESSVPGISDPALASEHGRLKEAIEKALKLLDVPAISSVQSLMGHKASADLSRAVRLLKAVLPADTQRAC